MSNEIKNVPAGVATGETVKYLLDTARNNGFAYPAVNVVNTNSANAALEAAA
ncbi:fructose-bisphosphate aldolase, partial [Catenovulum agarivorans DS-2]